MPWNMTSPRASLALGRETSRTDGRHLVLRQVDPAAGYLAGDQQQDHAQRQRLAEELGDDEEELQAVHGAPRSAPVMVLVGMVGSAAPRTAPRGLFAAGMALLLCHR
jgi:hypothetical protein